MQIITLPREEASAGGATHRIVILHSDLTQASTATAQTLNTLTLGVGTIVEGVVKTRLVTPFADSADTANNTNTITIGDAGSAARYLASQELNANGSYVSYKAGTGTALAYTTAGNLTVTFGAPTTGKTLLALDTGELHIMARIVDMTVQG